MAKKVFNLNIIVYSLAVTFLVVAVNQLKFFESFTKTGWIGDSSVYRNQVEVVNYIYNDAKEEQFNTATFTPPIFDYPYQYLFKWYGKAKYGYIPTTEKARLFYLILEPDIYMPQRQSDWLKVREGDGHIISTKDFPSGIKVQKRFH